MELKQLRYVIEVAKWNSFNRAASVLGVTQPSLSQHINKIEREFGITIFERTTRQINLTSEGQLFIVEAEKLLRLAATFQESFGHKAHYGLLRIGFIPSISRWKLKKLIPAFCKAYPSISVVPYEMQAKSLCDELLNIKLDVTLSDITPQRHGERVEKTELYRDTMQLIIASEHPLARKSTVDLAELKEIEFIFAGEEAGVHSILNDAFIKAGYRPNQVTQCSQIDTVLELVKNQVGAAFFSKTLINSSLIDSIAALSINQVIHKPLYLYVLKKQREKAEVKIFKQFALSWIEENIKNGA